MGFLDVLQALQQLLRGGEYPGRELLHGEVEIGEGLFVGVLV